MTCNGAQWKLCGHFAVCWDDVSLTWAVSLCTCSQPHCPSSLPKSVIWLQLPPVRSSYQLRQWLWQNFIITSKITASQSSHSVATQWELKITVITVIKSKQNSNLGSDETNTVGIKVTCIKYLTCIKQACSFAKAVSRISKIWFVWNKRQEYFLAIQELFDICYNTDSY